MNISRKNKERYKSLLANTPILGKPIINQLIKRKFPIEIALHNGGDPASSSKRSWIHFSVNKAATQYVKKVIKALAEKEGLMHASMHDYAFHSGIPFFDHLTREEMKDYVHVFKPEGYFYGPFGGMIEGLSKLEKFKVVLVVRDPRDMAVSAYFSKGGSHGLPLAPTSRRQNFIDERGRAQNKSIEDYVIDYAPEVVRELDRYREHLLTGEYDVHLCKYEDMVSNFSQWLDGILTFYCEEVDSELRQKIIDEHESIKPQKEDPSKHLRKGQPGDYLEKLDKSCIGKLNEIFEENLNFFSYHK